MTSLRCESKYYATFRCVGVLKIYLHLGLGVGLRGKLELPKKSFGCNQRNNKIGHRLLILLIYLLIYNRYIGLTDWHTHLLTYQNSKVLPEVAETWNWAYL